MEEMDRMTMGWWRPSPGSIYPLLDQLVEDKLVRKRDDGRYELTESARTGPDWSRGWGPRSGPRNPQEALAEMEAYVTFLEDLGRLGKVDLAPFAPKFQALTKRLTDLTSGGKRP